MALNAKNKFRVVANDTNNVQTDSEFDSDEVRENGAQPGEIIYSKKVNTGLRESSLIATALVEALISDEDNEIGPNSQLDKVVEFFRNKLSNLSRNKTRTLVNATSGDTLDLEWNDDYYVINKSESASTTLNLGDIDTNIYQTCTMMLVTNAEDAIITFDEELSYYFLQGHTNMNITVDGNKFTFADKGNYLITLTVKDSGTVYVNILKGEYTETIHLENPKINSYVANSTNGSYPKVSLNVSNTNDFEVNVYAKLNDADEYVDKGTISANSTIDIELENTSLYDGTAYVKFAYTTKTTKEVESSKAWTSTFKLDNSTHYASGSSSSTSRTITITGVKADGNATIKLYYKTWRSTGSEPSDYSIKTMSVDDLSVTASYDNSTYSTQYIYAKSYLVMEVNGQTISSTIQNSDWTLAGQTKPTLTKPTVTSSRPGPTSVTFTVSNPNSVSCNVYIKLNSGSYSLQSTTVGANSSATYTITGITASSGTYAIYLSATNYSASADATGTYSEYVYPTLSTPTVTYVSRGYCGYGTMSITVKNPNSVSVTVYVKAGSGSYENKGTISGNTTSTISLTGVADSSGTVYAYLTATDYQNSNTSSVSYPECTEECSCVSDCYTCTSTYAKCTTTVSRCLSTVSKCTSTTNQCTTDTSKCTSTQTQCTTSTNTCSSTQTQCTSTESQCSSTESQCSTSYNKCSSTVSKCTTTVSACTTTQSKCTDTTSKCTTTTSLCTTPIQACTTTESSCSSTQTQCSDDTSKCMTEYDTCTSIQTKCSSTESQCSTTKYQCSSTASKCTTTQSSCTSTVSQCTDSTSQCSTTASKCTTNVSTCTTSIQTSACMTTEGTCSANVSLALDDVPTDVELTSDVDSSKDIQVDTTDLDILGLS